MTRHDTDATAPHTQREMDAIPQASRSPMEHERDEAAQSGELCQFCHDAGASHCGCLSTTTATPFAHQNKADAAMDSDPARRVSTTPATPEAGDLASGSRLFDSLTADQQALALAGPQPAPVEAGQAGGDLRSEIEGYRAWGEDVKRLTRQIDLDMHGEEGAAKQASLCDLVGAGAILRSERDAARAELAALRASAGKGEVKPGDGWQDRTENMQAAYLAGFYASAEGYNAEYPFDNRGVEPFEDDEWCKARDVALARLDAPAALVDSAGEARG